MEFHPISPSEVGFIIAGVGGFAEFNSDFLSIRLRP